jgi:hypothetical protein
MNYFSNSCARIVRWNIWPLARLGLALTALASRLHWGYGMNPPTTSHCAETIGGLIILLGLCALAGRQLVRLYLALLFFPLYAAVVLNALWYDGSRHLLRQLCGSRRPWLEVSFGLAVELCLFISLGQSAVLLLRNFGSF